MPSERSRPYIYDDILWCAMRYAMGRETYVITQLISAVMDYLPFFLTKTIDGMIRDIDEHGYLASPDAPDMTWSRLYFVLNEEQARRKAQ